MTVIAEKYSRVVEINLKMAITVPRRDITVRAITTTYGYK